MIPFLDRAFFHTIPIEKSCVCTDSPSLDLLDGGYHSPSEVMQGNTAFSIFGLWEQRTSDAKESLVILKDLPQKQRKKVKFKDRVTPWAKQGCGSLEEHRGDLKLPVLPCNITSQQLTGSSH